MTREELPFTILGALAAWALVFTVIRLATRPLSRKAGKRDPDESWLAAANRMFKSLAGFGMLVPMVVVAGLPPLACQLSLGAIPPGVWQCSLGVAACIPLFSGFAAGMIHRQHAQLLRDTPTHSTAEAPQGHAELQGRAVGCCEALRSPLSGTPCIWWRVRSELIRRPRRVREDADIDGLPFALLGLLARRRQRPMPEHITRESPVLIALQDSAGLCHIHLKGAEVGMPQTVIRYGSDPYPARADTYRQGFFAHLFGNYRYTETLIQEGDALFAHGEVVSGSRLDSEPGLRQLQDPGNPVSKLMRLPEHAERPFAITFRSEQQLQEHHRRQARRLLLYTSMYATVLLYLGYCWLVS